MSGWTPHIVSDEAIKPISEYCKSRNYKCKGCRYSIRWIIKDYNGFMDCVFGNCPCDWEVENETVSDRM